MMASRAAETPPTMPMASRVTSSVHSKLSTPSSSVQARWAVEVMAKFSGQGVENLWGAGRRLRISVHADVGDLVDRSVIDACTIAIDQRVDKAAVAGRRGIARIVHNDLERERDCHRVIESQHGLCHIAEFVNDRIAGCSQSSDDAQREQRHEQ